MRRLIVVLAVVVAHPVQRAVGDPPPSLRAENVVFSSTSGARIHGWWSDLIAKSDVIVIARVQSVRPRVWNPFGDRYAYATVIEVWKGPPDTSDVELLASPTWACDIADAEEGETVLLFLKRTKRDGSYEIMHAGRGRMPIREIDGESLVTMWGVTLPPGISTEPGVPLKVLRRLAPGNPR